MSQADDNIIRVPLRNPEQTGPVAPPVAEIASYLLAPRTQPAELGGISFSVEIQNQGAAEALLRNPLDGLRPLVRDSAGWPVRLPAGDYARSSVNYRGPFEAVRPYTVTGVRRSDGQDLRPIMEQDAWPIPAGQTVRVDVRLERGALHGNNAPEPGPIPRGNYRLMVFLALVAEYPVYSRLVVRSELIPVTVGAPPAALRPPA